MIYELKRINAWSVTKVVFLVSFIIGACLLTFSSLTLTIISNIIEGFINEGTDIANQPQSGISLFFFILFLAIFIALSNSFIMLIFVGLYNFIANYLGGIKVEISTDGEIEKQNIPTVVDQEYME